MGDSLDHSANPPTKEEILAKYKDRISKADFKILVGDTLPTPKELQDEKAFIEFWGRLKGFAVWAKKTIGGVILALIFLHECFETYRDFKPYAIQTYSTIGAYLEQFPKHQAEPATSYIVFTPEYKAPARSFLPAPDDFILPETGVYPVSGSWHI